MMQPRLFTIATLFLAGSFASLVFGQGEGPVILYDQTENSFCTEDVRARMDSFMVELQQRPGAVGFIVGSADSSIPGRFQKYFKAMPRHVIFRQFDPSRIKFYRAPDGSSMRFDYWISADGVSQPELPPAYRSAAITEATLFDSSLITSISGDGVEFGYDSEEPCDWGLDLIHFAMLLNSDTKLDAYLAASAERLSKVNFARKALNLTTRKLVQKHGISARRIRTKFVGVRERDEMQLWIVPPGNPEPEFRTGVLR